MRISKKLENENQINYVWSGGNIIGEYGIDGSKTYLRGAGGEIVKTKDGNSEERYFAYNGHGDTTSIVEKAPESVNFGVTATYEYDAFGNLIEDSETGETHENSFRYNGQQVDEESGLIYLRNRYYNPEIGRFITEDPYWNVNNMIYGEDGNNGVPSYASIVQSSNLYVYCMSEPVNFADPWGSIREAGYNKYGQWSDNPDRDDYGEDSLIYSSLVTLGNMWGLRPDNRQDIEELANRVREIGNQIGIEFKISIAISVAPDSANATDVVLMAGDMDKAFIAATCMNEATSQADRIYGTNNPDGSQHNALKHTMWNALMTKKLGSTYARLAANAHEFGAEENYNQSWNQQSLMNMDLFNNGKGRELGATFQKSSWLADYNDELADAIVVMINTYQLWVVNWQ